ncbi:MAG TPA: ABC transporter ATP-binding protein [Gemmataceae bacterium]|jgi:iron(III) transport system ATP-binding protein|nr:ABC transporter ATP-binding protein [Gemmataceae bacterium]
MTPIFIQDLSKRFGPTVAVDRVTLRVAAGELFFLLGPSGCGKTTLLRALAGFVEPDAGEIFFGDQRITPLPPRSRDAAMVFQAYALWPHMTVARNVAYGLQVRGLGRQEVARRVESALKLVRLEGLGERRPAQLSGGQQQRVALARALVIEPRVLLLDEPLSNLDARLRDEMREEIRRLHRQTGLTMVYVTHDQKEALALAERLAVMDRGRLVQVGTPADVYNQPATPFVASFLGDTNLLPGTVHDRHGGRCTVETALGPLTAEVANGVPAAGAAVVCSIRPQALALQLPEAGLNRIAGTVEQVTFLGELIHLRVAAAGGIILMVVGLPHDAARLRPGDSVTLAVEPAQVVVLQEQGPGP